MLRKLEFLRGIFEKYSNIKFHVNQSSDNALSKGKISRSRILPYACRIRFTTLPYSLKINISRVFLGLQNGAFPSGLPSKFLSQISNSILHCMSFSKSSALCRIPHNFTCPTNTVAHIPSPFILHTFAAILHNADNSAT
jgi:hypothetical protein